MVDKDFIYHIC